jgi:hypothetical protein
MAQRIHGRIVDGDYGDVAIATQTDWIIQVRFLGLTVLLSTSFARPMSLRVMHTTLAASLLRHRASVLKACDFALRDNSAMRNAVLQVDHHARVWWGGCQIHDTRIKPRAFRWERIAS